MGPVGNSLPRSGKGLLSSKLAFALSNVAIHGPFALKKFLAQENWRAGGRQAITCYFCCCIELLSFEL